MKVALEGIHAGGGQRMWGREFRLKRGARTIITSRKTWRLLSTEVNLSDWSLIPTLRKMPLIAMRRMDWKEATTVATIPGSAGGLSQAVTVNSEGCISELLRCKK